MMLYLSKAGLKAGTAPNPQGAGNDGSVRSHFKVGESVQSPMGPDTTFVSNEVSSLFFLQFSYVFFQTGQSF